MRLIYFTKYSRNGASSRIRSYQYFEGLRKLGYEVVCFPFFSANYLERKYKQKSTLVEVIRAYFSRIYSLFKIRKDDILIIEYELFPFFFGIFEYCLKVFGITYVVDYDDAVFHNYDSNPNAIVRYLFGKKIDGLMKNSSLVTVGNDYLAQKAISTGAKEVILLPTVVNLDRYQIQSKKGKGEITIGWIGSPSTVKYLKELETPFAVLSKKYDVKLVIVGAPKAFKFTIDSDVIEWKEDTEVGSIHQMNIGIMPLDDSPWSRGKCGYKLIQYMACGLPVVASPVGINTLIVEHGENGFLANNADEWIQYLGELIEDEPKRILMGKKGRAKVERNYSLEKGLQIVTSSLKKLKGKE